MSDLWLTTHDDRLVGLEAPPPLELQVLSGRNGHGGLQSGALLQREEGQATLALGAVVNPGVFAATVAPNEKKTIQR